VLTCHFDQADHVSVVKAIYDYEASAPGELSVKEDDVLLAFEQEDDWLLVQSEKDGKAGFVPANYVEVCPCYNSFASRMFIAFDLRPLANQQITPRPHPPPRSLSRHRYACDFLH
jgi:hypothetical protein